MHFDVQHLNVLNLGTMSLNCASIIFMKASHRVVANLLGKFKLDSNYIKLVPAM